MAFKQPEQMAAVHPTAAGGFFHRQWIGVIFADVIHRHVQGVVAGTAGGRHIFQQQREKTVYPGNQRKGVVARIVPPKQILQTAIHPSDIVEGQNRLLGGQTAGVEQGGSIPAAEAPQRYTQGCTASAV